MHHWKIKKIITKINISSDNLHLWLLFVVFPVAVLIKYLFIFKVHPLEKYIFSDMMSVKMRAINFIQGTTTPYDSLNPPAQHLLTVLSWSLFADKYTLVKIVHFAAGIFTPILVYKYCKNFLGRNIANASLFIFLFHYPLLTLNGLLLPETIYTLILATLCYLLIKSHYPWSIIDSISIGLVIGFSLWWKGNLIFFIPLLLIWQMARSIKFKDNRLQLKSLIKNSWAPLLITISIILASLSFYHWHYNKKLTLIASQSGFVFTSAICPERITSDKYGVIFQSPTYAQLREQTRINYSVPFYESSFFWKRGFKCLKDNPMVIFTKLRHIQHLFLGVELWPSNQTIMLKYLRWYQNIFNIFLLPGILIGLLLAFKSKLQTSFIPILLCLSLFILGAIFPMEIRYRIPFDVIFIPLGVWGWNNILEKLFEVKNIFKQELIIIIVWFFLAVCPFIINFARISHLAAQ